MVKTTPCIVINGEKNLHILIPMVFDALFFMEYTTLHKIHACEAVNYRFSLCVPLNR